MHTPNIFGQSGILTLALLASVVSVVASIISFNFDIMIAYGDAESHLNIAKRVTHSLTPGLAQLGGIWLPLPHIMMVPFTYFDTLWRTGIAGALVSGLSFVVSTVYIYKFLILFTGNKFIGMVGSLIFMSNPNILYMQTTAMTELPLIMFFLLSSYYFVRFLVDVRKEAFLLLAALFGFAATLSRYDGWFLVLLEAFALGLFFLFNALKERKYFEVFRKFEGLFIAFATLSFFGIILWIGWDYLILGDPLYFTNSPFSAKSQQQGWLSMGMLLTYNNLLLSTQYYVLTAYENIGKVISISSILGFLVFVLFKPSIVKVLGGLLLVFALFFYVATLYLGQSIILLPSLTPDYFEWQLFNVRYGIMLVPAAAIFTAYILYPLSKFGKYAFILGLIVILGIISYQTYRYVAKAESIVTLDDGVVGLSSASKSDAQDWLQNEYDHGLVLIDDYARTLSIIRSGIPMENAIYIGNKPYWEESLESPEEHARWIVMQKNDAVWKALYEQPEKQGRLYKYFEKVYTSEEILIFKKNSNYETN